MTEETFDPYRKWLGIRDAKNSINHYRLLGVELFEDDPEVIENAADARMALVRTFQSGKRSEASQKILNELSIAKIQLLNGEKKAKYDRTLQASLPASSSAASPDSDETIDLPADAIMEQDAVPTAPPVAIPTAVPVAVVPSSRVPSASSEPQIPDFGDPFFGNSEGKGSKQDAPAFLNNPSGGGSNFRQRSGPSWLLPAFIVGGGLGGIMLLAFVLLVTAGDSEISGDEATKPSRKADVVDPSEDSPDYLDSFAQPAKAEPTEDPPRLVREDPPRTNPNELFKQWRERIGKRPGKGRPLAGRPPATRVSPYQQQVFQASGAVIGAAFRDRSRQVVSVSLNGEVELWDVKSGDKIAGKDGDASQSAAFTPDGKYAMAASANGSIRVISLPDMRIVHVLEGHQGTVRAMTVLPGGRLMSAGIDKTVRIWDLTTGAEVHKSESEDGMVFALAVSPDESTMAVAGYLSSSVLLLDLQQQPAAPLGVLEGAEGHDGIIRCLAFSPDGRLLLSGSRGSERTALVWDWKAKTVRRRLPGHPEGVTAAAFFPNGKTVVIGSGGMAGKGKPGGKYREAVIQVWDVESARSLAKLPGHWWAVTALSVSSDGKLILSGGFDGSVRVWKKPSAADESSKLDASLRGPREARDDRPRNATLSR